MRVYIILLFLGATTLYGQSATQAKTIHVYVALCDNINQGIVPVPKKLGNGQDPSSNLYWGALYGVKTHFKRSSEWTFIKTIPTSNPKVLERVLFKHNSTDTFLLADAYDGEFIKETTIDFFKAASGDIIETVTCDSNTLEFGGGAGLIAYIGHDGLMEFDLDEKFKPCSKDKKDAIMLACISKEFFKPYLEQTGANPLIWTTGLMAPEAYTLEWAIEGWIVGETDSEIRERAAAAYHHYQKCGMRGARGLLVTGY